MSNFLSLQWVKFMSEGLFEALAADREFADRSLVSGAPSRPTGAQYETVMRMFAFYYICHS